MFLWIEFVPCKDIWTKKEIWTNAETISASYVLQFQQNPFVGLLGQQLTYLKSRIFFSSDQFTINSRINYHVGDSEQSKILAWIK